MDCKIEKVIYRIRVYAFGVAGMNRSQLAKAAGLSEMATRDIHKAEWNPTLNTIRALELVVPQDFVVGNSPEAHKNSDVAKSPSNHPVKKLAATNNKPKKEEVK
jgi:DNA-binding XRE family transcriptional regulator